MVRSLGAGSLGAQHRIQPGSHKKVSVEAGILSEAQGLLSSLVVGRIQFFEFIGLRSSVSGGYPPFPAIWPSLTAWQFACLG